MASGSTAANLLDSDNMEHDENVVGGTRSIFYDSCIMDNRFDCSLTCYALHPKFLSRCEFIVVAVSSLFQGHGASILLQTTNSRQKTKTPRETDWTGLLLLAGIGD